MAEERKSWLRRRVEGALTTGFNRAYTTVRVDPDKFLLQLRAGYRVPISGYHGVFSLEIHELDVVAESIIRGGMKMAAVEGAGFGLGGLITIVPDLGVLSAITMRTVQKLSLLYGFQFNTDDEIAELWIAAASAAGLDVSREFVEKEVVQQICAAGDSEDCGEGERGDGGEVGGAGDSAGQFGDWSGIELLVCASLGGAGTDAFSAAAFAVAGRGTREGDDYRAEDVAGER